MTSLALAPISPRFSLPVQESLRVYNIALRRGHDQRTALIAAKKTIDRIKRREYAPDSIVGASWFQTPGGIQSEMSKINGDMMVFSKEITEAVMDVGYPTNIDPKYADLVKFYRGVWTPFIQEWQAWYANHDGWWTNFWWNNAPHAEEFQKQLIQIREKARTLGMNVGSPTPQLPRSPIEDTVEKVVGAIWGLVKVIIYAGIFVGGFVLIRRGF